MRRGSLRIGARGLDAKNGGEIFAAITYAERCRKVQIWLLSGPARSGGFSDEAICAGLDGAANLKIAASSGGRANRPYQKLSTIAPKKAKPLQAQQHSQPTCLTDHPSPALLTRTRKSSISKAEHRAPPCGHFVRAAHGFPSKHSFFGASPRRKPSLYKHNTHSPPA